MVVIASTVGRVVNIFESLFDDVDDTLKRAISEISSDNRLSFKIAAVPPTIALVFTQDPLHAMCFKQDKIHAHLNDCLQGKYFVNFPL